MLIFKGLTARRLYKSFGVEGLIFSKCNLLRCGLAINQFLTPVQNCEMRLSASSRLCARPPARPPALMEQAPTGRILIKFGISVFF
jgi:hypothetical protein